MTIDDNSAMTENFNKSFSSVFTVEDLSNKPAADYIFSGGAEDLLQDITVSDSQVGSVVGQCESHGFDSRQRKSVGHRWNL